MLLQMQTHGEKQLKTGAILSELGAAYLKAEGYARAIQHFEHAALIFTQLDLGDKLDSVYLQLIEVYLIVGKSEEFHSVLSTLEQRLDEVADFSDRAFAMLNEIG